MGMEIGNVNVMLKNQECAEEFLKIMDKVLRDSQESYCNRYESIEELKEEIEYDEGNLLEMTFDIWGLFDDPSDNGMEDVVKEFVQLFPNDDIDVMLYWSWDNCGDSATHTITYLAQTKSLCVRERAYNSFFDDNNDDDDSDDDDWDEEDKEKTIRDDEYRYENGKFVFVTSHI